MCDSVLPPLDLNALQAASFSSLRHGWWDSTSRVRYLIAIPILSLLFKPSQDEALQAGMYPGHLLQFLLYQPAQLAPPPYNVTLCVCLSRNSTGAGVSAWTVSVCLSRNSTGGGGVWVCVSVPKLDRGPGEGLPI